MEKSYPTTSIFLGILGGMVFVVGCCSNFDEVSKTENSETQTYLLQGTLFNQTIIGMVDGELSFLRPKNNEIGMCSLDSHCHYFDIISGQWFTDTELCSKDNMFFVDNIEELGSLFSYLTEEEMKKVCSNELKNEDIVSIMYRIKESFKYEEKVLTKTK